MKILSLVVALFLMHSTSKVVSVEEIRDSYKQCNISKENADNFYELTKEALQNEEVIYKGYHGAALTLKAAFSWNPFNKISYFNKGRKMIDEAILEEPENIELRMIRLSIQTNAPKIVGYYKNIDDDKDFIINNIKSVSAVELKELIEGYIADSGVF